MKLPLKHQQVRNNAYANLITSSSSASGLFKLSLSHGTAGASDIPPFDFSQYMDEEAGSPHFLEYHQEQLQACGLNIGRNGYWLLDLQDLHEGPLYDVKIGERQYYGGVDVGVVPHAVRPASAAKLLRVGFLHKQSTQDKAAFRVKFPNVLPVRILAHNVAMLALLLLLVSLNEKWQRKCFLLGIKLEPQDLGAARAC